MLSGSPPQVRGKPYITEIEKRLSRITPAGAGKTGNSYLRLCPFWDHPRRCGENGRQVCLLRCKLGSPPQVRGKPAVRRDTTSMLGITPAGAGKTNKELGEGAKIRDHPRRCGENFDNGGKKSQAAGSPPQVRGKQFLMMETAATTWITPAGAGKTVPVFGHRAHNRDHPRRCGENGQRLTAAIRQLGSPPQVRGKQLAIALSGHRLRITPAGAGKTLKRSFRNQPFCS